LIEVGHSEDSRSFKKIIDYVVNRQNTDGGYTFCKGAESNLQDTYFGLAILSTLGQDFPHVDGTVKFMNEAHLNSIYSTYYATKASLLLGKRIGPKLKKSFLSILNSNEIFGSITFFSEASSEFTTTFMALELVKFLKIRIDTQQVASWLLNSRNNDGGFGAQEQSNINSTYYAVASINLLKQSLTKLSEIVAFVRKCEKIHGGFTAIPLNYSPYIDYTYYGIMTLDLFSEKIKYPNKTRDFVLSCQNDNGGFARSDLGVSTFENTFQALEVLRKINSQQSNAKDTK